jgi:AcrR family transcriptional regulator
MSFEIAFEHSTELFNAALDEFIEKGYEQASINTILKRAGMSKGQFYYHFKTKEDLYLALIAILIARKREFVSTIMRPEDFQQDLFGIVRTQIRYGLMFARAYPAISRFGESFVREQGSAIYKKALAIHNFENDSAMTQLIEAGVSRGDLRDDLPLAFMHKLIAYLITHAADLTDLDQFDSVERNLDYLITFLKSGLGRSG